jgi:hypothetical protein
MGPLQPGEQAPDERILSAAASSGSSAKGDVLRLKNSVQCQGRQKRGRRRTDRPGQRILSDSPEPGRERIEVRVLRTRGSGLSRNRKAAVAHVLVAR